MIVTRIVARAATSVLFGAVGLAASSAPAQDRTAATQTVDAIDGCRRIPVDADRLACFDKAASALVVARGKGELIVLDREKVVERRRQRFGLAMDTDPGINAAAVKELATTIRGIAGSRAPGRYDLELANGSVWQTIDPVRFPPRIGDPIELKTASMGGFRARIDGRSILIKRIR